MVSLTINQWLSTLEDFQSGLSSALLHLQAVENYAKTYPWKNTDLSLTEIHGILQIFLMGLNPTFINFNLFIINTYY
jgi:hypothetical protein